MSDSRKGYDQQCGKARLDIYQFLENLINRQFTEEEHKLIKTLLVSYVSVRAETKYQEDWAERRDRQILKENSKKMEKLEEANFKLRQKLRDLKE